MVRAGSDRVTAPESDQLCANMGGGMSAADHRNAPALAWTRGVTLGFIEGCAVTGEPVFAFYGRTVHVHGRLPRPVGAASRHMYITGNTLSRT